uniref:Venom allergen-like (VAL) 24 protein n=1 Tax=Schistosoma mansoni TaxID=6183 RepID=A0A3Q0KNE3_SCHMA
MTASSTKTRYQRMMLTLLLGICFVGAVFGLDPQEAQLMLRVHNDHRAYRKLCGEEDIVPAEEILQPLEWDDKLAAAAQSWSEKCNPFDEEPIGNVGKWDSVGRNSAIHSELAEAVAYWMKESNYYDHNSDLCEPSHHCNTYKQIVEAQTAYVGCGYTRCEEYEYPSNMLIACYYSPKVMSGPPYTDGTNGRCGSE